MHHREGFPVEKGLAMWYVYNRMAIQQSSDLCRVLTSHSKIMSQPQVEMTRIYDELWDKCGVPVPDPLTLKDIRSFVDDKLQHGKTEKEDPCVQKIDELLPPSTWTVNPNNREYNIALYRKSIHLYCAMIDNSAYRPDYAWDMNIKDH